MTRLILEINGSDIKAYSDADLEIEVFDIMELRAEYVDDPNHLAKELQQV